MVGDPGSLVPDFDEYRTAFNFGGHHDRPGISSVFNGISQQVCQGSRQQFSGCDNPDGRIDFHTDRR